MDIYRRERSLSERAYERGEARRTEQTIDKIVGRSIDKRGVEELESEHNVPGERDLRRQEINEYLRFSTDRTSSASGLKGSSNPRFFILLDFLGIFYFSI